MADDQRAVVRYPYGPDSTRRPGVPEGTTIDFDWTSSAVFPGTSRSVRVYLPAAHDASEPAALMLFQDGSLYLDPNLDMRAGIVLDNLAHGGDIPPVVGVFVDAAGPDHRNAEYDPADDRYAEFLLSEIVPRVREEVRITDDPDLWAVCGGSSGGSCAFTVAWHRPDSFRRVLGFVSSFAQIPGGNPYPEWIRDRPRRPLRVFLQEARNDLNADLPDHNWYAENLGVAAALAERGYDHRLVLGDGGHSPQHGGAILPEALRWLWR